MLTKTKEIEKKAAQSSTILAMLSKHNKTMEPTDIAVLIDLASELSADISSWFLEEEN
ncbi:MULTISPECIES: hypothetical protein [Xenorhabdus]|uniref:Transcriptional regulator n=1 Tax=Xenorhabdus stockiae TaxID=351614 RepID=A0A2D0KAW5_9GAMM|nr:MULTISPECIES: hypothetical protein [Xenorhabdus]PHM51125.1 exported hypothetical protein [Xenorhabdus sp. KK7.4]PHM60533.1 exported hypothetical protein [Xenorhabdus stockiae]